MSSINQYTEFLFFTKVAVRCPKTFKSNMYYWVLTVYALIEGRKSLIQQHWMNFIQRQLWFCSMAYMRFMKVSTRVDQDWCMSYNSLHWDLGEETYLKFMKLVPGEHSALLGLSLNIYFSVSLSSWKYWTIFIRWCQNPHISPLADTKKACYFPTPVCLIAC
jgi:hypothetical protein